MPFTALNLDSEILKALVESGYSKPTPIQENAIPKILEGCDLLASAQTGSGKTAAFILPALNRLRTMEPKPGQGPRILILVPTRELAMQVATQAVKYSKYMPRVKTVCLYGGTPYPVQNRQLARPYEILVATPGRLIDQYDNGRIDLSRIEMFVLDEADRMLDMGFISSVERLSSLLPKKVQTVLFSATLEGDILRLAKTLLNDPVEIRLASNTKGHQNIQQQLYYADNLNHKLRLLDHLLEDETIKQAIIFTSTKFFANELENILNENGHQVGVLHGDLNQRQRTNTTRRLRDGQISLLVATDVAARGIDIPAITHVFNFDLPPNIEDYTHRIGRTGRADAKGVAISLALSKDRQLVKRIEQFTGKEIEILEVEGMKPTFKDTRPPRKSTGAGRGPKGRGNDAPRGYRGGSRGGYSDSRGGHSDSRSSYSDRAPRERSFDNSKKEFSPRRNDGDNRRPEYSDRAPRERSFDNDRKEFSPRRNDGDNRRPEFNDRAPRERSFDNSRKEFSPRRNDGDNRRPEFNDRAPRQRSFENRPGRSPEGEKSFGPGAHQKPRGGAKYRFSRKHQD
jgi:superfamily II DNA/RNA helicase